MYNLYVKQIDHTVAILKCNKKACGPPGHIERNYPRKTYTRHLNTLLSNDTTVSYTHLDVYKRQQGGSPLC